MQFDWKEHATSAEIDLRAALTTEETDATTRTDILGHLSDSRKNLDLAIEALEEIL